MDTNFDTFIRVSCVPLSSNRITRNTSKSDSNIHPINNISGSNNEMPNSAKPNYSSETIASSSKRLEMLNRSSPSKRFGNDVRKEVLPNSSRASRSQGWESRGENSIGPRSSSQGSTYKHLRSKDLEKMRADLDTLTDQLTQIEKNLPSLMGRGGTKKQDPSKKSGETSQGRASSSFNEAYNASEFKEESRRQKRPSHSKGEANFYSKLSTSLADNYDRAVMRGIQQGQSNRSLVCMIQRELEEWRAQHSKNASLQTEAKEKDGVFTPAEPLRVEGLAAETDKAPAGIEPASHPSADPPLTDPPTLERPTENRPGSVAGTGTTSLPETAYPLDRYLMNSQTLEKPPLPHFEMRLPYSSSDICRETADDMQIIEKTAQLLKEVEHHWKKSMFHPHNPIPSPNSLSDSLNDSECENYIERLAAIHFNKAIHKQNQAKGGTTKQSPRTQGVKGQTVRHICGSKYVKDDTSIFSFEEKRSYYRFEPRDPRGHHQIDAKGKTCQRCVPMEGHKCQLPKGKPEAIMVLPKQQYMLKKTPRRSYEKSLISGGSLQPSPRDRYQVRGSRSSSDIPSPIKFTPRSNLFGVDKVEVATNTDQSLMNTRIVNITSSVPDPPPPIQKPAKNRIVVQQLPQVDIRPELTKQVGPSINITVPRGSTPSSQKDKNNVAVFSCVHSSSNTSNTRNANTSFCNITRKRDGDNETDLLEKSLAARLELRSVAENFLYRLQSEPMPSGCTLIDTIYTLVDLVNSSIEAHLKGQVWENAGELPHRIEMVSDLLSDELKTWGAQSKDHYLRIDSIIRNLILDIQLSLNPKSIHDFNYAQPVPPSSNDPPKCKYIRSPKGLINQAEESKPKEPPTSGSRKDMTLAQKLLKEKSQKVKRLEKIYRTNCELKMMNKKREISELSLVKSVSPSEGASIDDGCESAATKAPGDDVESLSSGDAIPPIGVFSDKEIESDVELDENWESSSKNDETGLKKDNPGLKATSRSHSVSSLQGLPKVDTSESDDSVEEDLVSEINQAQKGKADEVNLNETFIKKNQVEDESGKNSIIQEEVLSDYEDDWEAEDTSHTHHSPAKQEEIPDSIAKPLPKNRPAALNKNALQKGKHLSADKALSAINKTNDKIVKRKDLMINESHEGFQNATKSNEITTRMAESSNNMIALVEPNSKSDSSKPSQLQILTLNNAESETLLELKVPKAKENQGNYVRVHSRSKTAEIKLSYSQSKRSEKGTLDTSSDSSLSLNLIKENEKNKAQIKASDDWPLEKRKLEEMSVNIINNLFEEKISAIMAKYAETNSQKQTQSTSDCCRCSAGAATEPHKPEIKFEIVNVCREPNQINLSQITEENSLQSPSFKLQVDNKLLPKRAVEDTNLCVKASVQDSSVQTENLGQETVDASLKKDETRKNSKGDKPIPDSPVDSQYSDDAKSLINLVYDLDSSDDESSEKCSKNKSEVKNVLSISTQTGKQVLFHRFNSDEFLVYPRLEPQPLRVEDLEVTTRPNGSTGAPFFLETVSGLIEAERVVPAPPEKSNFNQLERLHPPPEEVLKPPVQKETDPMKSTTTQTLSVVPATFSKLLKRTPNLVEHVDLSWSQGSSNHDSPIKSNTLIINRQPDLHAKPKPPHNPQTVSPKAQVTAKMDSHDKLKKKPSQPPSKPLPSKEKIVTKHQLKPAEQAQNKAISTTSSTSDTESSFDEAPFSSSSASGSQDGNSQMLRLLQNVRYAEKVFNKTPSTTSSESSTSGEWMVETPDDNDHDPLSDLPELINYLDSYKSPRYGAIRLRHCTRHTGASDNK